MTFAYDPFVAPLREVEIEDDITSFEILPYETLKAVSEKHSFQMTNQGSWSQDDHLSTIGSFVTTSRRYVVALSSQVPGFSDMPLPLNGAIRAVASVALVSMAMASVAATVASAAIAIIPAAATVGAATGVMISLRVDYSPQGSGVAGQSLGDRCG